MTELYFTDNFEMYEKVATVTEKYVAKGTDIKRTNKGKPYYEGNPVFFNLSHSGDKGVISLSDKPVGVDLEMIRGRNYPSTLSHFSKREQKEIKCERDFLEHWTAKEAFIKMKGATLFEWLRKLEYLNGEIFLDGKKQDCKLSVMNYSDAILAVCSADDPSSIKTI
jgi:4'-phosphopantetheinyl transferase